MNKILIRANIISAIETFESSSDLTEETVHSTVETLKSIEDQNSVMRILVKELFDTNDENRLEIILFLLDKIIPKAVLEDYIFKLLKSKLDDTKKYKLINI